jgi:hypothetical protein
VFVQSAFAAFEAWRIRCGLASRHWAHTMGTLQKIWVEDDGVIPGDSGDEGTHTVRAHYRYQVAGRWYEARRMSYGFAHNLRFGRALDLMHGLRRGSEVDVFYDPGRPQRAVLIPGASPGNAVALASWLIGVVLCLWALA